MKRSWTVLAVTAALAVVSRTREPLMSAAVVVEWNARLLAIADAEDHFLTLKGVRTAAMMHLAIHDALAAIHPRYRPYRLAGVMAKADPVAAANEAAYAVVVSQYRDQVAALGTLRDRWRSGYSRAAIDAAQAIGRRAADAILEAREGDGWNATAEYHFHPMGPGVYAEFNTHSGTPKGFVFGAGWATARPFFLDRASALRVGPPPAIASEAYTRAFREVKDVGAHVSATRTLDQSHLAMWWKEFVESSHNRLARELITAHSLDLQVAARFLAMLNANIFDGYVASFDSKFAYNHWRPYTAIRWASHDGNPDTDEDATWTNLHDHTYAFPSYPSAHGTVCAAAMRAFAEIFGAKRPFAMTIPEVDAAGPASGKVKTATPTRRFTSFSSAARECADSRVYLGIHFRYDSDSGYALGRRIGDLAVARQLVPLD